MRGMQGYSEICFPHRFVIVEKIKGEARLWVLADAKRLGDLLLRD
jgi:hypothetical protein